MALLIAVAACIVLWQNSYQMRSAWPGLPQAATPSAALVYGFGDRELSYRNIGMMLQNAGDIGGRTTNFKDYNYKTVSDWLWLTLKLDDKANYIPNLAAYYFGATQNHEDLRYLFDYLAEAGKGVGQEQWRWLAQAVFLARFELKDMDKALDLANELAALPDPDMPIWTRQMPGFVMSKVGKKKAARDLMLTVMATTKNIDPAEINQTCWYVNHNLREKGDDLDKNAVYQAYCANNPNAR